MADPKETSQDAAANTTTAKRSTKKRATRKTTARKAAARKISAGKTTKKTAARKTTTRKTSTRKAATRKTVETESASNRQIVAARAEVRPTTAAPPGLSAADRRCLIAETAYFKAMRRGFRGGEPVRDWFEAQAEVDARLSRIRSRT